MGAPFSMRDTVSGEQEHAQQPVQHSDYDASGQVLFARQQPASSALIFGVI